MKNETPRKGINTFSTVLYTLLAVFVGLKMFDVVDWSWWWVTLPAWGPLALLLILPTLAFLLAIIVTFINTLIGRS